MCLHSKKKKQFETIELIAKVKMKNIFFNIFNFISKDKNQRILKKINLLLSFLCIYFIWNIFTQYKSNILFNLTIEEAFLVIISYILAGLLWSKYMKDNYQGKLSDYFYNWSFSKIGKFIPTGLVTLTVREDPTANLPSLNAAISVDDRVEELPPSVKVIDPEISWDPVKCLKLLSNSLILRVSD